MKSILSAITLCFASTCLFGQMPTVATMQSSAPEGTSLGANNTLSASGIALGNRVKMRGFIDFRFDYTDLDDLATDDDKRFRTAADIDFLFDFSPVTGEVHLAAHTDGIDLEQAFFRYSFNQDFSLTAGRQLTVLSFEKDESPNMYQTSYAYLTDVSEDVQGGTSALESFIGLNSFKQTGSMIDTLMTSSTDPTVQAALPLTLLTPQQILFKILQVLSFHPSAEIMSMVFVLILTTVDLAWLQACTMDISPIAIT